ncbi:MAG: NAD(P)/FAD-dependent oxidoreductase [Candidatus Cloacimonetes bacterium]|nr:NAD(P)/FAD-dependent oxidoreductase [Candidatus Cloacimonadota bacterium]
MDRGTSVLVVGAGPAGLTAAITAAQRGYRVIMLDGNRLPGRKLLLTGKGRCNLTNACDNDLMISNILHNGKFLINALYQFGSSDTIAFFASLGLPTKTERGNRVFPASDQARDVLDVLLNIADKAGVDFRSERVIQVSHERGIFQIKTTSSLYHSSRLIIATGGMSYPATGSTGDGYRWAAALGHRIVPTRPALVPLVTSTAWIKVMNRLLLKNCGVEIISKSGRKLFSGFGEIELDQGMAGGALLLTASSQLDSVQGCRLLIDLKPALSPEQLQNRIEREVERKPGLITADLLRKLLPAALAGIFPQLSNIKPGTRVIDLKIKARKRLVELLKSLPVELTGHGPFSKAVITAGGVDVQEVDPQTMGSRLIPGLYFAGEVLDLDGLTGGFNLQIAWTTGFVAGSSC